MAENLTTDDGRKVVSFSTGGESYTVETSEQSARGELEALKKFEEEIKLQAMKRGIRRIKL